ncbi:MAG TPA: YSC84-related protein [Tepidisphaeraceae bacterium]|nr:YSC84-related protein [Tepidisphaeraceae bacterium]
MRQSISSLVCTIVFAGFMAGCSASPRNEKQAASLDIESKAALESFKAQDPTLKGLMDKAVAYVVFPTIGKAAWIVGGSYGKGQVYDRDGQMIGYADVSEISVGLQGGAQAMSELLIFLKQSDVDNFKSKEFSLGGNVSAVALTAGAAAKSDPSKGVIALVDTKGGLMAEAAVAGQRIRYRSE